MERVVKLSNQGMNQNTDFLTKQHHYAREKERADKILARYDLALKMVLGFGAGIFFPLFMVVVFLSFSVPIFLFLLVVGGGTAFGALQIKKRKTEQQAKLDAQIISKLN